MPGHRPKGTGQGGRRQDSVRGQNQQPGGACVWSMNTLWVWPTFTLIDWQLYSQLVQLQPVIHWGFLLPVNNKASWINEVGRQSLGTVSWLACFLQMVAGSVAISYPNPSNSSQESSALHPLKHRHRANRTHQCSQNLVVTNLVLLELWSVDTKNHRIRLWVSFAAVSFST